MDKPNVSGEVVIHWRALNPPGRFLEQIQTPDGEFWKDVGDRKAKQRTSQSLRERQSANKRERPWAVKTGVGQSRMPPNLRTTSP